MRARAIRARESARARVTRVCFLARVAGTPLREYAGKARVAVNEITGSAGVSHGRHAQRANAG